ncbi:MAG TPA: hypothetical protein QF753_07325 [Victivallales bacterium]|nr:hypothetical protein [Victivallales bacterium]
MDNEQKLEIIKDKARELAKTANESFQKHLDLLVQKLGAKNWGTLLKSKELLDEILITPGTKKGVKITPFIEKLQSKYAEQDNRMTAYPFCVTLSELVYIGTVDINHSLNGNVIIKEEFEHYDFHNRYDNKEDLINDIRSDWEGSDKSQEEIDNYIARIKQVKSVYIWKEIEWFLTVEGAKEYIKLSGQNKDDFNIYIRYINDKNKEIRRLLREIGFRVSDADKTTFVVFPKNEKMMEINKGKAKNGIYFSI